MAAGMQAAFAKVGVEADARTRLNRALQKAAAEFPSDIRAAAAAVRVACSRDLGMLFELTIECQLPAAEKLLREIMNVDRKVGDRVSPQLPLPTDRPRAGQTSSALRGSLARPQSLPKPTRSVSRAEAAVVMSIARKSILDTHRTEFDKPIGDCTWDEVDALIRRTNRNARFYAALRNGQPPPGSKLVRETVTAEAADTAWRESLND